MSQPGLLKRDIEHPRHHPGPYGWVINHRVVCTESLVFVKGACPITVWLSGVTGPSRLVTLGEHPHHGANFVC